MFPFKQQLEDAVAEGEDSEFHEILRTLRNLYPRGRSEYDLRILAFVRRDRIQTERVASEIAQFNPEAAALYATSPAAELAHYDNKMEGGGENEA